LSWWYSELASCCGHCHKGITVVSTNITIQFYTFPSVGNKSTMSKNNEK
jgi:hypothetical protein